jgi:hypothetical protein
MPETDGIVGESNLAKTGGPQARAVHGTIASDADSALRLMRKPGVTGARSREASSPCGDATSRILWPQEAICHIGAYAAGGLLRRVHAAFSFVHRLGQLRRPVSCGDHAYPGVTAHIDRQPSTFPLRQLAPGLIRRG